MTASNPTHAGGELRIGLALSGGGYRAALFHAGVLDTLNELEIPIKVISSISGGSILAAAYATGTCPKKFVDLAGSGRFAISRTWMGFKLAASLLPHVKSSRSKVQANLLDRRLLRGVRLADTLDSGKPHLMIGATDLYRSALIGLTGFGTLRVISTPPMDRMKTVEKEWEIPVSRRSPSFMSSRGRGLASQRRLADVVAASGAFPAVFDAMTMRDVGSFLGDDEEIEQEYLLADGGILDNFGVAPLLAADGIVREAQAENYPLEPRLADFRLDLILASDGSAFPVMLEGSGLSDQLSGVMDAIGMGSASGRGFLGKDLSAYGPSVMLLSPRRLVDHPIPQEELEVPAYRLEELLVMSPEFGDTLFDLTGLDRQRFLETLDSDLQAVRRARESGQAPPPFDPPISIFGKEVPWEPRSDDRKDYIERLEVGALMQLEIRRRIRDFAGMATLTSEPGPELASSIYRLGRYVVLINHGQLRQWLQAGEVSSEPPGG